MKDDELNTPCANCHEPIWSFEWEEDDLGLLVCPHCGEPNDG